MMRYILILLFVLSVPMLSWGQTSAQDTVQQNSSKLQQLKERVKERVDEKLNEPYDTTRDGRYWWRALKHGKVNFKDSTIHYPKFVRFCYNTYVWGDRAFNSYDSAYVVSTGKNWKLIFNSNKWLDTYSGQPFKDVRMIMNGDLVSNIGISLSFMAVSVGYSVAVSNLIHGEKLSNKVEFSFTCARFAADAYYWENDNETNIIYRDKSMDNERIKFKMSGMSRKAMGMTAYYFFNNRRYAQAAAYCYSKYQKRNAGTWLAGISLQHYDIKFDVEKMPDEGRIYFPTQADVPRILYNDYCILFGYGYNWVLGRKWLLNLTVTPYVGYRYNLLPGPDVKASALSLNLRGKMAAVYNHKQFFAGLQGYADHHGFQSNETRIVSSILNVTLLGGIRF